jgi:hypothetical protein
MEWYFTNFDSHPWLLLASGNPHKIMSKKLRAGEEGRQKPKGKGKGECHGCTVHTVTREDLEGYLSCNGYYVPSI